MESNLNNCINPAGETGRLALFAAVARGMDDKVRELLDAGVDPNTRNPQSKMSALWLASARGKVELVKILLAAGADVSSEEPYGGMPFLQAVSGHHTEVAELLLEAGADKVSINTAAVLNPELITRGAERFGAQCIVLGMDAKRVPDSTPLRWVVHTHTGADGGKSTGQDAIEWAIKAVELGAGEITVNSIDADGTQAGYDLELLRAISETVTVPVVASGGAGEMEDLHQALVAGKADAVLAASIYHYGIYTIRDTKKYLTEQGIPMRM